MDFFKSVFSESPPSTPTSPNPASPQSWPLGSTFFRTIASKSESLLDNYYKDLQEFSSGLKKETSVIRQAASRAVQELPARLESGAAIAQESLEAVGQAIDTVGSTVSDIIGKDLNFASGDLNNDSDDNTGISDKELNYCENAKPYSRIEAMIRGMQCSIRTYCDEVEEADYGDWKIGFSVEEKRGEIERLIEENGVIKEIYDEVVQVKVDEETFWCRYFYRVEKAIKAEEARARIVKRVISGEEEEELSWDIEDDDDDEYKSKGEKGKGVEESGVENRDNEGAGVSGTKSDVVDDEGLGERLMNNERESSSEGKLGSDISIISSQRSSHVEDDLGWDEIEAIRSGDEINVGDQGSPGPDSAIDLRKRLSIGDEDEELTWDIEDDDEPDKL